MKEFKFFSIEYFAYFSAFQTFRCYENVVGIFKIYKQRHRTMNVEKATMVIHAYYLVFSRYIVLMVNVYLAFIYTQSLLSFLRKHKDGTN